MKQKKILIVYVRGFINNLGIVEKTFNHVVNELLAEGRTLSRSTQNTSYFEDGTVVSKVPFSGAILGKRITHLYIDESILELQYGITYVNEVLKPLVVPEGNYNNIDASGKPSDRIMVFNKDGINKLK